MKQHLTQEEEQAAENTEVMQSVEEVKNQDLADDEYFFETVNMIQKSLEKFITKNCISVGEFLDKKHISLFAENVLSS